MDYGKEKGWIFMILNVAICDDDIESVTTMSNYLKKFEMNYDIDFKISMYTNGTELLSDYKSAGVFHVLFLDVEMPTMSGLEIAQAVRSLPDRNVKIVFFSNYPKYMQDSFNVRAFHYISKPLRYSNIEKIMKQLLSDLEASHVTKLLIKGDYSEELIAVQDIIAVNTIDARKRRLSILLTDRSISISGILNEWEEDLAKHHFIYANRKTLININHIHYIAEDGLVMSNQLKIPMSRRNEKQIRDLFSKRVLTLFETR